MDTKTYYTFATKEELANVGVQESSILDTKVVQGDTILHVELTQEQVKQLIPEGPYCYDNKKTCPFWDINTDHPRQENGYCHFLKKGDWEGEGLGLLWDACKECGINEKTDNYEE